MEELVKFVRIGIVCDRVGLVKHFKLSLMLVGDNVVEICQPNQFVATSKCCGLTNNEICSLAGSQAACRICSVECRLPRYLHSTPIVVLEDEFDEIRRKITESQGAERLSAASAGRTA